MKWSWIRHKWSVLIINGNTWKDGVIYISRLEDCEWLNKGKISMRIGY